MYKDGGDESKRCKESTYNGGRGLCTNHLNSYRYHISKKPKEGEVAYTWEMLEEQGLLKKKLSQDEKNINQMHKHRSYTKRK